MYNVIHSKIILINIDISLMCVCVQLPMIMAEFYWISLRENKTKFDQDL